MQERESALAALERRRKYKKMRRRAMFFRCLAAAVVLAVLSLGVFGTLKIVNSGNSGESGRIGEGKKLNLKSLEPPSFVEVKLISNKNARRGISLKQINSLVVHYTGNPGTSAQNNRDYFDNFSTSVCSHFVVGLEGEIIQCVPMNERSAASNHRNSDTLSIEVCHEDESGRFSEATYASLIKLLAWLCDNSGLDSNDIIRHYDVTGKLCPLYYVENEDAWQQLKEDVKTASEELSNASNGA